MRISELSFHTYTSPLIAPVYVTLFYVDKEICASFYVKFVQEQITVRLFLCKISLGTHYKDSKSLFHIAIHSKVAIKSKSLLWQCFAKEKGLQLQKLQIALSAF